MFRLFLAAIIASYLSSSGTVMGQPCTDDSHCALGFFCDTVAHACSECFRCGEINRQSLTLGSTCVSSVVDCGSCLDGFIEDSTLFPRCIPLTMEETETKSYWTISVPLVAIGVFFFGVCYYCYKKQMHRRCLRIRTSQSAKFSCPPMTESPPLTPSAPPPPSSLPSQLPLSSPFQWQQDPALQRPPNPPIPPPAYDDVYSYREKAMPSREMSTNQNARRFNRPFYDGDPQNVPSTPQESEAASLLNNNQEQNVTDQVDNTHQESEAAALLNQEQNATDHVDNSVNECGPTAAEPECLSQPNDNELQPRSNRVRFPPSDRVRHRPSDRVRQPPSYLALQSPSDLVLPPSSDVTLPMPDDRALQPLNDCVLPPPSDVTPSLPDDRALHPAGYLALLPEGCDSNNNSSGSTGRNNDSDNSRSSNNNDSYNTSSPNNNSRSHNNNTSSHNNNPRNHNNDRYSGGPTMVQAINLVIKMPDININNNSNQPRQNHYSNVSN